MNIILIGLFGSLGVMLRHLIGQLINFQSSLLSPILISNILGCLLFGFFSQYIDSKSNWQAILLIGLCGGLTTFSSFIMEVLKLLKTNQFLNAFLYIFLSVTLGILIIWLGSLIGQVSTK